MTTQLRTTKTELHALYAAEDKTRRGAGTVKVPREALKHLLADHHKLFSIAKGQVVEPKEVA